MENKLYKKGLFIFHRDLRTIDNTGLLNAHKKCSQLYTCFIFTPEQIGPSNKYRSLNAVSFMFECLDELENTIKKQGGHLITLYGNTTKVLKQIIKELNIDAVFFNEDYTPYAVARDKAVGELCQTENIDCIVSADYYLQTPGTILSDSSKEPFKKFTPFYDHVVSKPVLKPVNTRELNKLATVRHHSIHHYMPLDDMKKIVFHNKGAATATATATAIATATATAIATATVAATEIEGRIVIGGRTRGLKLLANALKTQAHYEKTRDFVALSTSHLSAHLKFGTISIRETYYAFAEKYGRKCEFIRQLYWRDFFAHLLFYYPDSIEGHNYKNLRWNKSKKWVDAWKSGKTGFPIIDAGMRELDQTGYMHNRTRLIVANFFSKTLGLDWKIGEQHFAKHLTDYDVASNNGNWQTISSTGIYHQAYFRDVNPWIQTKKLDYDCVYIKRWVPELANVENRVIHNWFDLYDKPEYKGIYIKPIVDYREQKSQVLELYTK